MPGWNAGAQGSSQGASYKINDVQRQVDEVKNVMHENVEVMLSNIDKTEVLENKSAELAAQAKTFHKSSREVKRHWCKQNAKMNILLACVCITILVVIIIIILVQTGAFAGVGGSDDDTSGSGSSGGRMRRLLFPGLSPLALTTDGA